MRHLLICTLMLFLVGSTVSAATPGEAADVIGERLLETQRFDGSWPGEALYTGSITPGMVAAYQLTCDDRYRVSAEIAGDYIMLHGAGGYFGDEAFALTQLADISALDDWKAIVRDFYLFVEEHNVSDYISWFHQGELSFNLYYLANHLVAVNAVQADISYWKGGVNDLLLSIDDQAHYPVLALASAVWALAQVDGLSDAPLTRFGVEPTKEPWKGMTGVGLVDFLLSHQITEGELAGGFYWRFDHGDGGTGIYDKGYTEDTIMGALGLIAAYKAVEDAPAAWKEGALKARAILLDSLRENGMVASHLLLGKEDYKHYAGELLYAIAELTPVEDVDLSGAVDMADYTLLEAALGSEVNQEACRNGDLDRSGVIDEADLAIMLSAIDDTSSDSEVESVEPVEPVEE